MKSLTKTLAIVMVLLVIFAPIAKGSNETTSSIQDSPQEEAQSNEATPPNDVKQETEKEDSSEETLLIPLEEIATNSPQQEENEEEPIAPSTKEQEETNTNETEFNNSLIIPLEVILGNATGEKENKSETPNETNDSGIILPPPQKDEPSKDPPSKEFLEEEKTQETKDDATPVKKIKTTLMKNNQVEIEGLLPENFDTTQITKKESQKSAGEKEVTISSVDHVGDPLLVFTDIAPLSPDETQKLSIFWENENKFIEVEKFLDSNEDGLYDRIGWMVPHLSTQTFTIIIATQTSDTSSPTIQITRENPTPFDGEVIPSPATFNFSINYSGSYTCTLSSPDFSNEITTTSTTSTDQTTIDLEDGSYSWTMFCQDQIDESINKSLTGTFAVNEEYNLSVPEELYVLDGSLTTFIKNTNTVATFSDNEVQQEKTYTLKKEGTTVATTTTTSNFFDLGPSIKANGAGSYTLNVTTDTPFFTEEKTFNVATISATGVTEANIDEDVNFNINIGGPTNTNLNIAYGDGEDDAVLLSQAHTFPHAYANEGTFTPELKVYFEGYTDNPFTIGLPSITITNPGDTDDPVVTLINPTDNAVIKDEDITFSYKVEDESAIPNCTYELFLFENEVGAIDYEETKTNVAKNTKIDIALTDFVEGEYTWYVTCYDAEGNAQEKSRDFTINYSNSTIASTTSANNDYNEKEEVQETLTRVQNLIEKIDQSSLETQEAAEKIGITANLTYFNKRLIQINQDLGTNLNFVANEQLRETKRQEALDEFNEIKNTLPEKFEVVESKEFTKNSITQNLESIITSYLVHEEKEYNKKTIQKIAKLNHEAQNNIEVATKVYQIKITYEKSVEEMTLVSKSFTLKNNTFSTILEVIPESFGDVAFLHEVEKIEETLYTIDINNLDNDEIIYTTKKIVALADAEETETLLYKEFKISSSTITGFFFANVDEDTAWWTYLLVILGLLIVIYLTKKAWGKYQMTQWEKEEDVERSLQASRKAKKALQKGDLEEAKELYAELKKLYPLTPKGFRKVTYPEIQKISKGIDRREIINLVKEYEDAKTEGRKEDMKNLYASVKKTYKRLPKKDQEKVYHKMFKNDW